MICIGIDPGMSGAIAVFSEEYRQVFPISMLTDETNAIEINIIQITNHITFRSTNNVVAYIEKVWKPSKLVRIAGILEGVMLCSFIPVYRVAPSTWRKEILDNKNATKEDAVNYCIQNFPDVSLLRTERSRVPDHNLAEALCIAEYAKRKHFVSEDQR